MTFQIVFASLTGLLLLLWIARWWFSTERIPMNAQTRQNAPGTFVTLTDGITHYRLQGPQDGPLVILIPGATLSIWVWNHLDTRLAQAGYRVLSYDLFGRGYSDRPRKKYDLNLHRRQLSELVAAVAPDQPMHLITLAFGTLIGADYARANPHRVKSLIAMGPDGFGVVMTGQTSSVLMQIPFVRDYVFSLVGTKALMARIPTYSTSPDVVDEIATLYRPSLNWKGFKRAVLSSIWHMPIHDARALYRSVNDFGTPVQLIWGEKDAVTPFPGDDKVHSAFPNARIEILPGGGHLPHFENADETASTILGFLQTIDEDNSYKSKR